ncbi:hypothetical protein H9L14_09985 [Sphingomonas sediminicola]|uniref:Sulfotransferase family protein n=1 Tax=Sphingomonas sediminicola TaxID=386874 RepID=A0ABX6T645_9SPHN|nr:hypothetical protein H9L14_09985 [Sphingomonas sediminicola]
MRDAVIASMETDWHRIAEAMAGDPPDDSPLWYQKQMAHHMVGPVAPDDIRNVTHAFLIRDPRRMVASYARKRETVEASDLGVRVVREFFDRESDRLGVRLRWWIRPMFWPTRRARCRRSAMRSKSLGGKRCCTGQLAVTRRTGSGRRTGTAVSRPAPVSRARKTPNFRCSMPTCKRSPMPAKKITRLWLDFA